MLKKILITFCLSFFVILKSYAQYSKQYVNTSTVKHKGSTYKVIYMDRGLSGKKINAKYFAAKDLNGSSVPNRFYNWSKGKNIICVTSGTYMDNYDSKLARPVGLTVDNGIVVNKGIADFDGLVIIYATGGIVATNLKEKNLIVQGGSISGIPLDIKGNAYHFNEFLKWCEENEATVFQTHLLVYKNTLKISSYNSSSKSQERRFLAVGNDEEGNLVHCIVHSPEYTTLYEGSKQVLNFLNEFKELKVTYMINLDTGAQDVFSLYDSDGKINPIIKGKLTVSEAINLLVYYYQ
jgi:hypothetical protein